MMRSVFVPAACALALSLGLAGLTGCGGSSSGASSGGGSTTPPPPTTYVLTVDSTAPATSGGNNFSSWTGCSSASTVTCTVSMTANTTVTANYATPPPVTYALTVDSADPVSGVAITVAPADNNSAANGTTSFTRTYNTGTSVTLTAPATSGGNNFSSWTGCSSASTVTCTVSMTANTTVTANYATPPPVTYALTVDSADPVSGVAITVAPADNNSAANGTTSFTRTYNTGTSVTLTAPATSGGNNFSS